MIARNRIWEELKQAKAFIICSQRYTDRQRAYKRYYNLFVAIASSVGALGAAINIYIPFWTSLVVGIVSIIKSISPNFLSTEQELSELDSLYDFYTQYMNSLEEIWYNHFQKITNEKQAMELFFKLKESECNKESQYNKYVRHISKKEQDKINKKAAEYINRVYFEKYNDHGKQ